MAVAVLVVVSLVVAACGDDGGIGPMPADAGPDAGILMPDAYDYFGEPCVAQPDPVITTCHAEHAGWCIAGVCRPMCSSSVACPGVEHYSPGGACYCGPR